MDPIIAATHADPYPYYAQLRADGGLVFHQGLKLWVASSARAVAAVLAHPDCHVRPSHEPVPKAIARRHGRQGVWSVDADERGRTAALPEVGDCNRGWR